MQKDKSIMIRSVYETHLHKETANGKKKAHVGVKSHH